MKKVVLLSFVLNFSILCFAQKIPFQGKLIESGTPVNGSRNIEVGLPDLSWSETHAGVQITDGLYFIVLGSITPLPANLFTGDDERQLTLSVDGTTLSPVILYKPLTNKLDSLFLKGSGNGMIKGGFGKGSAVNENLPYLKLNGNLSNTFDRISLGISSNQNNTAEFGNLSVSSTSGLTSQFSPGYLALYNNDTAGVQLFSQNWGNKGYSGTLLLKGPNTVNFEIGSKHWENADLPQLQMRGTTSQTIVYMTGEKYQEASVDKERGVIILESTDGRKSSATSNHFTVNAPDWRELVYIGGHKNNDALYGVINVSGPTSNNIQMGPGDDPDHGMLQMNGKTNELRARMFVKTDWDQQEKGTIELHGQDGNKVGIIPTQFALHNPDWGIPAALRNTGGSGELELRGPNSQNFSIGSKTWEDSDIPWFNMTGKDNQVKMNMTTIGDGNEERGIITLTNANGSDMTYADNGVWGSQRFGMYSGANIHNGLWVEGNIDATGTISAPTINQTSDERLKKEIQPLGGSTLNKIESLGGYSYFWKKEDYPEKNFPSDQQIGLLAQELETQFPALVKTGNDGFKSVNYNGFTAVLLEAVKELNEKMEKFESENRLLQTKLSASASQSAEMTELKNQVEFLTKLVQEKMTSATNDSDKTAEKK